MEDKPVSLLPTVVLGIWAQDRNLFQRQWRFARKRIAQCADKCLSIYTIKNNHEQSLPVVFNALKVELPTHANTLCFSGTFMFSISLCWQLKSSIYCCVDIDQSANRAAVYFIRGLTLQLHCQTLEVQR